LVVLTYTFWYRAGNADHACSHMLRPPTTTCQTALWDSTLY